MGDDGKENTLAGFFMHNTEHRSQLSCPGEFLLAVKAKVGPKLASKWLGKQLQDGTTLLQRLSEACGGDPDLLDDVTAGMLPSPPLPPALVANLVKAFQPPQGPVLSLYIFLNPLSGISLSASWLCCYLVT
jgi:hypothetical protein